MRRLVHAFRLSGYKGVAGWLLGVFLRVSEHCASRAHRTFPSLEAWLKGMRNAK